MPDAQVLVARTRAEVEISKVLRNTYTLLAMTVAFSAVTAGVSMAVGFPYLGLWMIIPYFGFLWGAHKLKNSAWGLVMVFGLTGWLGLSLGPILNFYIGTMGAEPVVLALGGTAFIFFATSGYVLITRKDLTFMTGFLMTGILVAFIAAIANVFLQISALGLAVSSMFLVLASGIIMWQTSAIIHGGERNYIMATITLYVMLYNIFLSLLHLIGFADD